MSHQRYNLHLQHLDALFWSQVAEALTEKLDKPGQAKDGAKRALDALKKHMGSFSSLTEEAIAACLIQGLR